MAQCLCMLTKHMCHGEPSKIDCSTQSSPNFKFTSLELKKQCIIPNAPHQTSFIMVDLKKCKLIFKFWNSSDECVSPCLYLSNYLQNYVLILYIKTGFLKHLVLLTCLLFRSKQKHKTKVRMIFLICVCLQKYATTFPGHHGWKHMLMCGPRLLQSCAKTDTGKLNQPKSRTNKGHWLIPFM